MDSIPNQPTPAVNGEITEQMIYETYPRPGFDRFALSAIRVAMRTTPPKLLYELTRRFAESWRGQPVENIPFAVHWFSDRQYLEYELFGPKRTYKPFDKPVYAALDALRNRVMSGTATTMEKSQLKRLEQLERQRI